MSLAHRVPVIDRMMEVLARLETAAGHPTVRDLAASCGVPRTTVYRILNTLESHGLVVRTGNGGGYQLGSRFLTLAARVPNGAEWRQLAEDAQPWLQRVATETGETAKFSVLDRDAALVVAVAQGPGRFVVAAGVGGRYPLHAGAASKVLLATMDAASQRAALEKPLEYYTPRTIIDARTLRAQLARIRRQGWAEDTGEYSLSVCAVGAPVRNTAGRVIGALSVVHFADRTAADRLRCREVVSRTAALMRLGTA
jgi:DNA-binding IclR family transcriptional regulator